MLRFEETLSHFFHSFVCCFLVCCCCCPSPQILLIIADLEKEEDVKRVADKTIEHFGRLDVLVCGGVRIYQTSKMGEKNRP